MGAVTRASPNTSVMMATTISCCAWPQWISAEMITGYGDVTKAYFAMARQISRTNNFEVRVLPWYTTGSISPSYISTAIHNLSAQENKLLTIRSKHTFDTAATMQKCSNITLYRADTDKLMSNKVGIV